MKFNCNNYEKNLINCCKKYTTECYTNSFNLYEKHYNINKKFTSNIFEYIFNKIRYGKKGPIHSFYDNSIDGINNYRLKVVKLFIENKL